MLGDVALRHPRLMGQETIPNAIEPEDTAQALAMLRAGVASADTSTNESEPEGSDDDTGQIVGVYNTALK